MVPLASIWRHLPIWAKPTPAAAGHEAGHDLCVRQLVRALDPCTTTPLRECVIPVEGAKLSLLASEIEESQRGSVWQWRPEAAGDEHTAWPRAHLKSSGSTGFPLTPRASRQYV